MPSPWQEALGDDFVRLDPQLTVYFSRIPDGTVGRGVGTFDVVGTPRRWLWPILAILGRSGVVFPVWERDVPFTVTNRMDGNALRADRVFAFRRGERVMTDAMSIADGELVDRLGRRARLEARFVARVDDGDLVLRSSSVAIRIGSRRVRFPRFASPSTVLRETAGDRQHVSFSMTVPLIGRIYEYSGFFDYELVPA